MGVSKAELWKNVRKAALDNGSVLVGITKIRRVEPVIVMAFPFTDRWFLENPFNVTKRLGEDFLASKQAQNAVARVLTGEGYRAEYKTVLSLYGDFRPLAVAAGLGEWGRNGLVVNGKYGSGLLFAALFTNAPLDDHFISSQQGQMAVQHCGDCNRCVRACPAMAFEHNTFHTARCVSKAVRGCAECVRVCRGQQSLPGKR